jgi:hypothetical protein
MQTLDCSLSLIDSFLSALLFTIPLNVVLWWLYVRNGTTTTESWFVAAAIGICFGFACNLLISTYFCS